MNRLPALYLWLCCLLLPVSVPAQLFQNHYLSFDLVSGQPLQFEFHAYGGGFEITGGENGQVELQALDDTTFQLNFYPDLPHKGEEAIRIQGVPLRQGEAEGQANYYLSLSISEGQVLARPDVATTRAEEAIQLNVLANDDSHLRSVFVKAIPSVSGGTVAFQPGSSELVFEPEPGFSGRASFTYLVCDAAEHCDLGEVTVWVMEDEPAAAFTAELFAHPGEELVLPVPAGSVLEGQARMGQVIEKHQTLRYLAEPGAEGQETLTFLQEGSIVYVQVGILPALAEGFSQDDRFFGIPGNVTLLDLLANDWYAGSEYGCIEVDKPLHGTLRPISNSGRYAYSAPEGFVGVDRFRYRVRGPDCTGEGDEAEVLIQVGYFEPRYDRYELVTAAGMPLYIENEVPVSNFVWRVKEEPAFGVLDLVKGDTLPGGQHTEVSNTLIYTPNPGVASGQDRMVLEYCLGDANGCAFRKNVEVLIDIRERNDEAVNYCQLDCVWPGDANDDGEVGIDDLLALGSRMGMQGPARPGYAIDQWIGQESPDWEADAWLKHVDTDGDGLISSADTAAIMAYSGRTNAIVSYFPVIPEATIDLVYSGGPVKAGDRVSIDLYLGSEARPVYDLMGFTFPFAFNPELIQPSTLKVDFHEDSWFGNFSPLLDMQTMAKPGLFMSGVTRTNRKAALGYGLVGTVGFIVTEDINGIRPGTITLGGGMAQVLDGSGNVQPVRVSTLEIPFEPNAVVTSTEEAPVDETAFSVFPNPARDLLQWRWQGNEAIEEVAAYDMSGRRIYWSRTASADQVHVGSWPEGIYILRLQTERRVLQQKVQVAR